MLVIAPALRFWGNRKLCIRLPSADSLLLPLEAEVQLGSGDVAAVRLAILSSRTYGPTDVEDRQLIATFS